MQQGERWRNDGVGQNARGVWGWRSQMGMKSRWGRCKVRGRQNAKHEDRAIDGGRDPCRGRQNP